MLFDTGEFDEDLIEDYLFHYTLDTIIEELNKPKSYQLDAFFGNIIQKPYFLDVIIRKPYNIYLMDAVLVMDRQDPRFLESIINAILISHARVLEELSSAIALMGLRLQLPYANDSDMDLYWAKVIALKRRYQESDEDYRHRLLTRLSIMKSSGTKAECESILNTQLGMRDAVDLQTYWPGLVRVVWTSYAAMRQAEANRELIEETLDSMLAAGISYSMSFPYKIYTIDVNLIGKHPEPYDLDATVSVDKKFYYTLRADIFGRNSANDDVDVNLETTHSAIARYDTRIGANPSKSMLLDVKISEGHWKAYSMDGLLKARCSAYDSFDAIAQKSVPKPYNLDGLLEKARRGYYQLAVELVGA
jgi:hypothetical protein